MFVVSVSRRCLILDIFFIVIYVYSAGNYIYMCGVFHVFITEDTQVSYRICGLYHVISNLYLCITHPGYLLPGVYCDEFHFVHHLTSIG